MNFDRFRMGIGRDVINGLRLDRNEKVDNWPKNFYKKIFQNFQIHFGQHIQIIAIFIKN